MLALYVWWVEEWWFSGLPQGKLQMSKVGERCLDDELEKSAAALGCRQQGEHILEQDDFAPQKQDIKKAKPNS